MTDLAQLTNRQIRLARRPVGTPTADDWLQTAEPVQALPQGGVVVRTLALSLDPAMRGWMNEGKSYIAPVGIGEVMRAGGVGKVLASSHPKFAVGDLVSGVLGVQDYAAFTAEQAARTGLAVIDTRMGSLTQWLNVLGMPGMTAYFGLLDVGQPRPGDTVVVSGAAGAVGQTVGQLVRAGLKEHCPKGVDVYFDNVGGDILDEVLARLAMHARIVICGAISQYNNTTPVQGPRNYLSLLVHRARMQGMVVFDYAERYPQAVAELAGYLKDGRMKSREDVVHGLDRFPEALNRLFTGENFGKLVLQVADEVTGSR